MLRVTMVTHLQLARRLSGRDVMCPEQCAYKDAPSCLFSLKSVQRRETYLSAAETFLCCLSGLMFGGRDETAFYPSFVLKMRFFSWLAIPV